MTATPSSSTSVPAPASASASTQGQPASSTKATTTATTSTSTAPPPPFVTPVPVTPPTSEERFHRAYMLGSNCTMMIGWAKVLRIFYRNRKVLLRHAVPPSILLRLMAERDIFTTSTTAEMICQTKLIPETRLAIIISFLEFFNALLGFTKSKPVMVLSFAMVRAFVELLVAPMFSSCIQWQHLYTVFIWSLGDTIRFGCFLLDVMVPNATLAKSIRYTIGPILFPFGALGEMFMVLHLAYTRQWYILYGVAALWPIGFYPFMKQLLRQRHKFQMSTSTTNKSSPKIKAV